MFLKRDNQFIIETVEGNEVFRVRLNAGTTRYIDTAGNAYYNHFMYKAPDYKQKRPFVMINVHDSISDYISEIYKENLADSIERAKITQFDNFIHSKYNLSLADESYYGDPEEIVRFKKDTLILHKINEFCHYIKEPKPFEEFDTRVQVESHRVSGHFGVPCFDHLHYYTVGKKKIKFKYKDKHGLEWKKYIINGKTYVYDSFGKLYLVND